MRFATPLALVSFGCQGNLFAALERHETRRVEAVGRWQDTQSPYASEAAVAEENLGKPEAMGYVQ